MGKPARLGEANQSFQPTSHGSWHTVQRLTKVSGLPLQVVALKDQQFKNPDLAVVHVPLALLPVAYPQQRFLQAQVCPFMLAGVFRLAEAVRMQAHGPSHLGPPLAPHHYQRHAACTAPPLPAFTALSTANANIHSHAFHA